MKKFVSVLCVIAIFCAAALWCFELFEVRRTGTGNGAATVWDKEFQTFANDLCAECRTDEEKIQVFYTWITSKITYDEEVEYSYQHFDASGILSSKKGICFDIANLFAAMCRSQGIRCYVLDGYSRKDSSYKHTWNRVFFNGCWYNVDVTYDTVRLQEGKSAYGFISIGAYDTPDEDYVITRLY